MTPCGITVSDFAHSTKGAPMNIVITVSVTPEGFFTNAQRGADFVCTTVQPTLEMSLASAMPDIRKMAERKFPPGEVIEKTCACGDVYYTDSILTSPACIACQLGPEGIAEELAAMAEETAMIERYEKRQDEIEAEYDLKRAGVCSGPRRPWESDYTSIFVALFFALISIASFSQI